MSGIRLRDIEFEFGEDIPFLFNPGNRGASQFVNAATFVAPAFERFLIMTIRKSIALISDARVKAEAELFWKQEALHAKYHMAHIAMLTQRFPELRGLKKSMDSSYDKLFEERSSTFHLAYVAAFELMFGPGSRFLINNRHALFDGGDRRITSFMMWHFVEEFEHRNCAYEIYSDIVGKQWPRISAARHVVMHLGSLFDTALSALEKIESTGHPTGLSILRSLYQAVPFGSSFRALVELCGTLRANPDPDALEQPAWLRQWFADEAAGKDMRQVQL